MNVCVFVFSVDYEQYERVCVCFQWTTSSMNVCVFVFSVDYGQYERVCVCVFSGLRAV